MASLSPYTLNKYKPPQRAGGLIQRAPPACRKWQVQNEDMPTTNANRREPSTIPTTKMAVIHRALFTWFVMVLFAILAVLRLDGKAKWNWFIIFIPMWVFDGILFVYIVFRIITHRRTGFDIDRHDASLTLPRKTAYLLGVVFKLTFQVLLCIRLQYGGISLYYVMIPAWVLLLAESVDVGITLKRWH